MKYFTQLNNLPTYDLYTSLMELLENKTISWPQHTQICLNTINNNSEDYVIGTGSLTHDWLNSYVETDEHGNNKTIVPEYETPLKESDFKFLCNQFIGTNFETVYNALSKQYTLGRVRIMKSTSKTCLSWHRDTSSRIHYPIKTQPGCFMVIEDEVLYLESNKWYLTETTFLHTAFNASKEDRIHLVVTVLD